MMFEKNKYAKAEPKWIKTSKYANKHDMYFLGRLIRLVELGETEEQQRQGQRQQHKINDHSDTDINKNETSIKQINKE